MQGRGRRLAERAGYADERKGAGEEDDGGGWLGMGGGGGGRSGGGVGGPDMQAGDWAVPMGVPTTSASLSIAPSGVPYPDAEAGMGLGEGKRDDAGLGWEQVVPGGGEGVPSGGLEGLD